MQSMEKGPVILLKLYLPIVLHNSDRRETVLESWNDGHRPFPHGLELHPWKKRTHKSGIGKSCPSVKCAVDLCLTAL